MKRLTFLFVALSLFSCKKDDPKPEPEYAVVVSDDGHGTASTNKTTAKAGENVTLTAVADEGYEFERWTGNVTVEGNSFVMPSEDVALRAEFVESVVLWPEPVDIPFEEYSLDGTEAEWVVEYGDPDINLYNGNLAVINSEDELQEFVLGEYPSVDFGTKTLLLAWAWTPAELDFIDTAFEQIADEKYRMTITMHLTPNQYLGKYLSAILIDKLPANSTVKVDWAGEYMETVRPVEASEELLAFFEQYLPPVSDIHLSRGFFYRDEENKCLTINSYEEFRSVALPAVTELPDIDFENYTLIIGQVWVGGVGFHLSDQAIDVFPEYMEADITIEIPSDYYIAHCPVYIWGVYPKLPFESTQMNTNYKNQRL